MHTLEAEPGARDEPLVNVPTSGQPELWAARGPDPLLTAFESELGAWLAWVNATRHVLADEQVMRRLEFVCGVGWTAATLAALAAPAVGVIALGIGLSLLAITLVVAYLVAAHGERPQAAGQVLDVWPEWTSLLPSERARVVRIINLSRVAARPSGAQLLLCELEEALAEESLADWLPLLDLRAVVQSGRGSLVAFDSEPWDADQMVRRGNR